MIHVETFTVEGKRGRYAYSDDILAAVVAHLHNLQIPGMTVDVYNIGSPSVTVIIKRGWALEGNFVLSFNSAIGEWSLTFGWSGTQRTLAHAITAVHLYNELITVSAGLLAFLERFGCIVRD